MPNPLEKSESELGKEPPSQTVDSQAGAAALENRSELQEEKDLRLQIAAFQADATALKSAISLKKASLEDLIDKSHDKNKIDELRKKIGYLETTERHLKEYESHKCKLSLSLERAIDALNAANQIRSGHFGKSNKMAAHVEQMNKYAETMPYFFAKRSKALFDAKKRRSERSSN